MPVDRELNKEILRLAVPSILANITVPLVGIVDTAVAGHLPASELGDAAIFIGGISVGTMMLNILYWMFGFLRTGTGGLTAQAFGRGEEGECGRILVRGLLMAIVFALILLVFKRPFGKLAMWIVPSSSLVGGIALRYFQLRIWAAPAILMLMVFRGWFIGMQDSISSMVTDLIINVVNIVASIVLSFGIGKWRGLGVDGIACGTLAGQYCGLFFAASLVLIRYGNRVLRDLHLADCAGGLKGFMAMNGNYFLRSLCFMVIYLGETVIAAGFGDIYLACNAILMQLLMVFSYLTDGFAYAGEALTGRFIGERNPLMLRLSVKYVFVWSMTIALVFMAVYALTGLPMVRLETSDSRVIDACREFLPWLILMPPLGCAAFTWDGIFMGATASGPVRNCMVAAMISFLAVWFIGKSLFHPEGSMCLHLLLAAYFSHLLARTLWLTLAYKESVPST